MNCRGWVSGDIGRWWLVCLCCLFSLPVLGQERPPSFSKIGQAADSARARLFRDEVKKAPPPPAGYLNDYEDLFTAREEKTLDSLLKAFEGETTIQIALVTLPQYMVARDGIDSFTLTLANSWGVGQKGRDNGVLVGISRGWRYMRIQTGKGIREELPDKEVKSLIDNAFLPHFRNGNYYEGTIVGLRALMGKLE